LKRPPTDRADLGGALKVMGHKQHNGVQEHNLPRLPHRRVAVDSDPNQVVPTAVQHLGAQVLLIKLPRRFIGGLTLLLLRCWMGAFRTRSPATIKR
jgi:hypothetical protein